MTETNFGIVKKCPRICSTTTAGEQSLCCTLFLLLFALNLIDCALLEDATVWSIFVVSFQYVNFVMQNRVLGSQYFVLIKAVHWHDPLMQPFTSSNGLRLIWNSIKKLSYVCLICHQLLNTNCFEKANLKFVNTRPLNPTRYFSF